jgi:hypothetical protein
MITRGKGPDGEELALKRAGLVACFDLAHEFAFKYQPAFWRVLAMVLGLDGALE